MPQRSKREDSSRARRACRCVFGTGDRRENKDGCEITNLTNRTNEFGTRPARNSLDWFDSWLDSMRERLRPHPTHQHAVHFREGRLRPHPTHQHAVHFREGKAPPAPQFTSTPSTSGRGRLRPHPTHQHAAHFREGKAPPAPNSRQYAYQPARLGRSLDPPKLRPSRAQIPFKTSLSAERIVRNLATFAIGAYSVGSPNPNRSKIFELDSRNR